MIASGVNQRKKIDQLIVFLENQATQNKIPVHSVTAINAESAEGFP